MQQVIFLEEMTADPVETLSSVFAFVGMDPVDDERGTKVRRSGFVPLGATW